MKEADFKSVARSCMQPCTPLLLMLLTFGTGCPASRGDGGGAGAGGKQLTLQEACAASCQAQAATNCPGVFPASECTETCLELQGQLHCPEGVWRDLNACMATAPLSCDRVNGGASVSSEDCGPELDAFRKCS